MRFVLRNHDGKLMLGSHENVSLLLHVLYQLHLREKELCAQVLIVVPDHGKPIPDFRNLLPASSEYLNSLITELRTIKTLAGPILVFFDQVPGTEIKKMIHFFKFGYVCVTPEKLYDFVQICQQFELHWSKKTDKTFVLDFYEPSTFKEFQPMPTKKRYFRFDQCKIKFDSKIKTNHLEVKVKLIMNKESLLMKNMFLTENELTIEAPSSPEPEDTSEADKEVETDPKLKVLQGCNPIKKRTSKQKIKTLHNTSSSSG